MHFRAFVSGVLLLSALAGCSSDPLPRELIQVWRSPAPGYSDRYFEVSEASITFGTGAGTRKRHFIESVQSEQVGNTTELTIEYRMDGGETAPLILVHTPGNPPHLQIGARKDQWVPEQYADWLQEENS
jgi:hypothetical protein